VGWDGVSADTVESTVTLSIDGELAESSTPVVVSVWNSAAAFGGEPEGVEVPVVGTSRSGDFMPVQSTGKSAYFVRTWFFASTSVVLT